MIFMEYQIPILVYLMIGTAIGSQYSIEYEDQGFRRVVWVLGAMNFWPFMILSEYFDGDKK